MSKTEQNILPFDPGSGRQDRKSAEQRLNAALLQSENIFGPYSGEVGLVLLAMVAHYKDDLNKQSLVSDLERRIDEIVDTYLLDQDEQ